MSDKFQQAGPVDEAARKKIVLDLDKTFLVEAGAGSGKTKSLVDRMIALLKKGKCSIDTLTAVTFTPDRIGKGSKRRNRR